MCCAASPSSPRKPTRRCRLYTAGCRSILEQADWPLLLGEADSGAEMLLRPAPKAILRIWPVASGTMGRISWNRVNDIDPITIKLETEPEEQPFELRHLRFAKKFKPAKGFNRVLMFGHDRSVNSSVVDNTIGLTLLDNDEIYIGCISSPYLNRHVYSERTAFTLSDDELLDIKRQLTPKIAAFRQIQVDKVLEANRRVTELLIHIYPQFLFLRDEMEDFIAKRLKAATRRPEDVFLEMGFSSSPCKK
jgi:hypothetical protein